MNRSGGPVLAIAIVGVVAGLAGCRGSHEQKTAAAPEPTAYFGEQHVHTAYSLDAYIGGARLTPDGAYRFAKGEEVEVGGQILDRGDS